MKKREPLTRIQDRVLCALVALIRKNHYQPTLAELAASLGKVSVQKVIERIADKGWIQNTGRARAIEIPNDVFDSIEPAEEMADNKEGTNNE